MAGDDASYEVRSARTMRGMEARTIAKWEGGGWEFVSQSQDSLMRSTLTFRRQKRKQLPLWWGAGAAAVVVVTVTIGMISERGDPGEETSVPVAATSTPTESAVPSSEEPTDEPTEEVTEPAQQSEPAETSAAEQEPVEVLTVENSQELAALLAEPEPGGQGVEEFAAKYEGRTIEFDGNIAYMTNHGSHETRYDMLIRSGDYSETSGTGPNFKFEDLNIFDLSLEGANIPNQIGERDNFRFVARVLEYNSAQELFFLEPVSTEMR